VLVCKQKNVANYTIPPYFVKVLREIERIAKREIEIEKVGESGT
jgi:hypothetical protein